MAHLRTDAEPALFHLAMRPKIPDAANKADDDYCAWLKARWFRLPADDDGPQIERAPPGEGFSLTDAFRWIDGAIALYQYFESTYPNATECNADQWSTITNAYLLIDNLRRRDLLRIGGMTRYMGSPDGLKLTEEIHLLTEARQYLEQQISTNKAPPPQPESRPKLTVDPVREIASLGTLQFRLNATMAWFLHVLILKKGEKISLRGIQHEIEELEGPTLSHLERAREKLPDELKGLVNKDSKGHWITRESLG